MSTPVFRVQWIANGTSHIADFDTEARAEEHAARQRAGDVKQVVVFEVSGLMQA